MASQTMKAIKKFHCFAESVLQTITVAKIKVAAAILLAVSGLAAGPGLAVHQVLVAQQPEAQQNARIQEATKEGNQPQQNFAGQLRTDRSGDPLPDGAVVRLGTLRWRAGKWLDAGAFASDGKSIACASYRGLWLFDKANGRLLKHIHFPRNFERLAFSPDGTRLACSGMVPGGDMRSVVQIWELPGGRKVQEFEAAYLQWLGWSADGQPLAVLMGKGVILLRELAARKEQRFQAENLPDIQRGLTSCAYAARGRILAVLNEQGIIHVWDTATGEKRRTLQIKGNPTGGLVLSPDGRSLALMTEDGASKHVVQLWNVATGQATQIAASDQQYTAVTFTPDSKTLATVGRSEIRLWDVDTGKEHRRIVWKDSIARQTGRHFGGGPFFGSLVLFSPDGKTLITTDRGTLHLWDVATSALRPENPGHSTEPWHIAFSQDGRRVASGGSFADGTIYIWDAATGESLARIHRQEWVRGCAFSADGRALFTYWTGNNLYTFDATTGRELYAVKLEDPDLRGVQQDGLGMLLSKDGKTLIALSQNASNWEELLITGWDTTARKQIFRRRRATPVSSVVSADGRLLAAVSQEIGPAQGPKQISSQGPLRLEDLATGRQLLTFPILEGQTQPLAFSPDNRLLATVTSSASGHTLRLWEVVTAAELLALPISLAEPIMTNSRVAFSPDSRVLAMPGASQEILLWDVRRGKELRRIKGFDAELTSLAFSPDGGRLVSGLSDSTLLVWDIAAARKAGEPNRFKQENLAQAWADLGADARKAFAARGALAESPEKAVSLLKEHLKPTQSADVQRLQRLLADLDSDRFAVRDAARKRLEEIGELALDALRRALAKKPSPEMRRRVESLIEKLSGPITRPEALRALRGVAVLEDIATPAAKQLLATLAQGAPEARLTQEAKASLERLARRPAATP